jgi:hypothetical protein
MNDTIICDLQNLANWVEHEDGTIFVDFRYYDQWLNEWREKYE